MNDTEFRHTRIALLVPVIITGGLLYFRPFGMGAAYYLLFLVITIFLISGFIGRNRSFAGYGVTAAVNSIAGGHFLLPRSLALNGFAVKILVDRWKADVQYSIVASGIALYCFWLSAPFAVLLGRLCLTFSFSLTVVLLLDMYVWMAAQRLVYWHCPETVLRDALLEAGLCPERVDDVVAEARKQRLLTA